MTVCDAQTLVAPLAFGVRELPPRTRFAVVELARSYQFKRIVLGNHVNEMYTSFWLPTIVKHSCATGVAQGLGASRLLERLLDNNAVRAAQRFLCVIACARHSSLLLGRLDPCARICF